VKFGTFTLKSGLTSPIYIDLRIPVAYPRLLAAIGQSFLPLMAGLEFTQLAALPYAAMPIGSAVSLAGNIPMIYPRKESKAYGTKADIEGVFKAGEQVVVIDDLITTGDSKFEGFAKLESGGLKVKDVVVLIDRESGGAELLEKSGYSLYSVFKFRDLLAYWLSKGKLTAAQVEEADAFLLSTVPVPK
jgi:uridine monophosphate synthetase